MNTSLPAKREELLKSFTRKKANDPEKLLQACMGSFYPDDSVDHRVLIRFIELVDENQAIITARVLNDFYSAAVSRDRAINSSTPYDIIVENGEYRHIQQKIISNTNNETRLNTLELPP